MSFYTPSQKRSSRSAGQALVEFALIFPILLAIIVGIIDLGRAFHAYIAITNASREGARYMSLNSSLSDFDEAQIAAVNEASNSGLDITAADVFVDCTPVLEDGVSTCKSREPVRVTVVYDLDLILGWVLPNPLHMNKYTEMLVP